MRLTPRSLGYKLSDDSDIPVPAAIDAFAARLMVESETDDDPVRKAFIGVFNRAAIYSIDKADSNKPRAQLDKSEKHVKEALEELRHAIRDRLK